MERDTHMKEWSPLPRLSRNRNHHDRWSRDAVSSLVRVESNGIGLQKRMLGCD